MAQANKHSLSRSGRDFNGCAHVQPEKIPQIHHAKSSPQYPDHEPSKREVLVLAKPLAHGFHTLSISQHKFQRISLEKK